MAAYTWNALIRCALEERAILLGVREPRVGCFPCLVPSCTRTYRRKGDRTVHMVMVHADDCARYAQQMRRRSSIIGKTFICPHTTCMYTHGYKNPRGLRRHLRQVHNEALRAPTLSICY